MGVVIVSLVLVELVYIEYKYDTRTHEKSTNATSSSEATDAAYFFSKTCFASFLLFYCAALRAATLLEFFTYKNTTTTETHSHSHLHQGTKGTRQLSERIAHTQCWPHLIYQLQWIFKDFRNVYVHMYLCISNYKKLVIYVAYVHMKTLNTH